MSWNNPQQGDLVGSYRGIIKKYKEFSQYRVSRNIAKNPDRIIAILYKLDSAIKAYIHYYYELKRTNQLTNNDFYKIMKGEK